MRSAERGRREPAFSFTAGNGAGEGAAWRMAIVRMDYSSGGSDILRAGIPPAGPAQTNGPFGGKGYRKFRRTIQRTSRARSPHRGSRSFLFPAQSARRERTATCRTRSRRRAATTARAAAKSGPALDSGGRAVVRQRQLVELAPPAARRMRLNPINRRLLARAVRDAVGADCRATGERHGAPVERARVRD